MAGGQASAKKLEIAERRRLAVQLRKAGGTFRQIADKLREVDGVSENYDHVAAYKDVIAELKRVEQESSEDVIALRRLELERIDEMWQALWGPMKKGDYAALDRLLALMNQRARYLPIFDQSDKAVNLNVSGGMEVTGGSAEMSDAELANKLLALMQGAIISQGQEFTITDGNASRQAGMGGADSGATAGSQSAVESVAAQASSDLATSAGTADGGFTHSG